MTCRNAVAVTAEPPRSRNGASAGSRARFTPVFRSLLLVIGLLTAAGAAAQSDVDAPGNRRAWSAGDLFASPAPYAVGHRGSGADAFAPGLPLENTPEAFQAAFALGIRVVELDLQQTADGKIVVTHDDSLPDGRCISAVTYDELLAVKPQVPLFHAVLSSSRHFAFGGCLSGIVLAEIKVPIPACNDDTTSAMAALTEGPLVAAVIDDIRKAGMEDQVILNSGSPSILRQAMLQAPEIRRALTLNLLQLLPPGSIPTIIGLPVRKIPKNDCGLDWYELGDIARLPTFYPSLPGDPQAFQRFVVTTLVCNGAGAVSLDKLVLLSNPGAAPQVVGALHQAGLEVIVWTIDSAQEAQVAVAAGADGITTNNIPMGLGLQAPPTCEVALAGNRAAGRADLAVPASALALYPARVGSSAGGSVEVEFALPDAGPARLALVDIAGRSIDSRDVGSFGAGRHAVRLGRELPPGVYLVRLSNGRDQASTKATVVR